VFVNYLLIYSARCYVKFGVSTDSAAESDDMENSVLLRISISFSLILGFLKVLFFLRINEKFGMLSDLMIKCIQDMMPFLVFFITFITVFAGVATVVETSYKNEDPSQDDYPKLPNWAIMLIQTYRNGIGDISPPDYGYWDNKFNIT